MFFQVISDCFVWKRLSVFKGLSITFFLGVPVVLGFLNVFHGNFVVWRTYGEWFIPWALETGLV